MIAIQESARRPTVARAAADLVLAVLCWGAQRAIVVKGSRTDELGHAVELGLATGWGPVVIGAYELGLRWLA